MLFGTRFVWVTDCYAICFILLYDGNNLAILRLQMCLMCWDVNIVHRNDTYLTDADYRSRLGADICYNPLFKSYLDFDRRLREKFPVPTELPMMPENMPYYCGPRVIAPLTSDATVSCNATYCNVLLMNIMADANHGLCHLSVTPVQFGDFDSVTPLNCHTSTNHEFPYYVQQVLRYSWAVYSFGGGHFASNISSRCLPFCIKLACNQYDVGCALFREFTTCTQIFKNGRDLLHHIRSSGDCSQIHGYLIHSLRFRDSDMTLQFWQMQSSIITQLRALRSLQMVIALIIPDHDGRCLKSFTTLLKSAGWVLSSTETSFPTNGDTVSGSCRILIGIHSSCASSVKPLQLKLPPPSPPQPLRLALWEPFNRPKHSVSLAKDDKDFMHQDVKFSTSLPEPMHPCPPGVSVKYFLHGPALEESLLAGAAVVSCDGLCPLFDATPNKSIFQHLFGLEFHFDNHTHVCCISPFEFA